MAVATPQANLSASTNGRPIAVAATASPGTTIHTAAANSGIGQFDEIWIWGCNTDTVSHTLSMQWGGTTSSDLFQYTIQPGATIVIAAGWRLNNGLIVKAYADLANKINLWGQVTNVT